MRIRSCENASASARVGKTMSPSTTKSTPTTSGRRTDCITALRT